MTVASPADSAVVVNGSFETPALLPGTYVYTPANVSDVTFNLGSGVAANGSAWGFANAPDGSQVAFLQSTALYAGTISLNVTGLTVGQAYAISFYGAARPGYDADPFTVSFGGTTLGNYTLTNAVWTQYATASFVATGTSGVVRFGAQLMSGDHDVGLDAVSVVAVPEPASWGLMLAGFGMIGAAIRRHRAATVASGR